MLSKALYQRNLLLVQSAQRMVHVNTAKNYIEPTEGLDDLVKYMDEKKPVFSCLFFTAKWNPACHKIEKDYENLCSEYPHFNHIRVDCDAQPKIKLYFDARVEPQFLVLVNGGEIYRQVGYNFDKLTTNFDKIQDAFMRKEVFFGTSKHTWERFYDEYDRWSKVGELERDSFRAKYESNMDQHRGAGTGSSIF